MAKVKVRIGTAGWSVPKLQHALFQKEGSHLERYAKVFSAVEINSSFYRDHQEKTYARWAEVVPEDFRFSVKLFKRYTHEQKLEVTEAELAETISGIKGLGSRLGALLVQLPPSLQYNEKIATKFFKTLKKHYNGEIAFEPRHQTWVGACEILKKFKVSKVNADPERAPMPELERVSRIRYFRLHGSPVIYKSSYSEDYLSELANEIRGFDSVSEVWCIFDNTALSHGTINAIDLQNKLVDL